MVMVGIALVFMVKVVEALIVNEVPEGKEIDPPDMVQLEAMTTASPLLRVAVVGTTPPLQLEEVAQLMSVVPLKVYVTAVLPKPPKAAVPESRILSMVKLPLLKK